MKEISEKIDRLRAERGWTFYRLEKESGVPAPTIRRWLQSDICPSIPILKQICDAFGLTLADFFAQGNLVELTADKRELHEAFSLLESDEKEAVWAVIKGYTKRKNG